MLIHQSEGIQKSNFIYLTNIYWAHAMCLALFWGGSSSEPISLKKSLSSENFYPEGGMNKKKIIRKMLEGKPC